MILLLGRWDWGGNLVIDSSHAVADDDQAAIGRLVDDQDDDDNSAWSASFATDSHSTAVQLAYEEYVEAEGTRVIDQAHRVEPAPA
ncbi:hypothetical protein ACIP9H_34115 [Streptomyces sp. NPDC088732]|uniref:hypothetical protein n=1 Tax=Streptomyces sp. NPDC088732 TaxID=3365879 RepID=UPI003816E23D